MNLNSTREQYLVGGDYHGHVSVYSKVSEKEFSPVLLTKFQADDRYPIRNVLLRCCSSPENERLQNTILVSPNDSKIIKQWDFEGKQNVDLPSHVHNNKVFTMCVHPFNENMYFSGSCDTSSSPKTSAICLWDVSKDLPLFVTKNAHEGIMYDLKAVQKNKLISRTRKEVKIWNISDNGLKCESTLEFKSVFDFTFVPKYQLLACCLGREIVFMDPRNKYKKVLTMIHPSGGKYTTIAGENDNIITGDNQGYVQKFNIHNFGKEGFNAIPKKIKALHDQTKVLKILIYDDEYFVSTSNKMTCISKIDDFTTRKELGYFTTFCGNKMNTLLPRDSLFLSQDNENNEKINISQVEGTTIGESIITDEWDLLESTIGQEPGLKAVVISLKEEKENLLKKIDALGKLVFQKDSSAENIKKKLEKMEDENIRIKKEMSKNEETIETMKKESEYIKNKLKSESNEVISKLKYEIESLKTKEEEQKGLLELSKTECKKLREILLQRRKPLTFSKEIQISPITFNETTQTDMNSKTIQQLEDKSKDLEKLMLELDALMGDVSKKETTINELRENENKMKEELDNSKKEKRELVEENNKMKKQMIEFDLEIEKLKSEKSDLEMEQKESFVKLKEIESAKNLMTQSLMVEIEKKEKEMEKEKNILKQSIMSEKSKEQEINNKLIKKLADQGMKLLEKNRVIDDLRKSVLLNEQKKVNEPKKENLERIEKLQNAIINLKKALEKKEMEMNVLREMLDEKKKIIGEYQEKIKVEKKNLIDFKEIEEQKKNEFHSEMENKKLEIAKLNKKVKKMVKNQKKSLREYELAKADCTKKLRVLEKEIKEQNKRINEVSMENQMLMKDMRNKDSSIKDLRKNNKLEKEKYKTYVKEVDRLRQILKNEKKQQLELEKKLGQEISVLKQRYELKLIDKENSNQKNITFMKKQSDDTLAKEKRDHAQFIENLVKQNSKELYEEKLRFQAKLNEIMTEKEQLLQVIKDLIPKTKKQ